jgi:hypothetical protein
MCTKEVEKSSLDGVDHAEEASPSVAGDEPARPPKPPPRRRWRKSADNVDGKHGGRLVAKKSEEDLEKVGGSEEKSDQEEEEKMREELNMLTRQSGRSMSLPLDSEMFEMVPVDGEELTTPPASPTSLQEVHEEHAETPGGQSLAKRFLARFRSVEAAKTVPLAIPKPTSMSWRKVVKALNDDDEDRSSCDEADQNESQGQEDLLARALAARRRTLVAKKLRETHHHGTVLGGLSTLLHRGSISAAASTASASTGHVMMGQEVERVRVGDMRHHARKEAVLIHVEPDDGKRRKNPARQTQTPKTWRKGFVYFLLVLLKSRAVNK